MRHVRNERGVVGLIVLAIVLVIAIGSAGYYVYQVRSGNSEPVSTAISHKSVPKEITQDKDANAAEQAGAAADKENFNDVTVSDADLK